MSLSLKIYQKDSTSNMNDIPTNSIDLIITSPPYWDLRDYNHENQIGNGYSFKHFVKTLENNLYECARVLKNDAACCFIVADIRNRDKYKKDGRPKIYSMQSEIIHFFTNTLDFELFQHFFWKKGGVKSSGIIYGSVCQGEYKDFAVPPALYSDLLVEHILIFRKPGFREFPPLNERFESCVHNKIPKDTLQEWLHPIWDINPRKHKLHKATFPDEIPKRLIKMYSLSGGIVLDPFAGTGTTLYAAINNNRNAIGYEINLDYLQEIIKDYNLSSTTNYLFENTSINL